jgi:RimJ/RimL family protein N-acetyltransferase
MEFDLQPVLSDQRVRLQPLQQADFEALYAVGADPLIWEQHPNPNRYQRPHFENFFRGAMESGGALLALDAATGAVIGSSRFYYLGLQPDSVMIGYSFLGRDYWGGSYNRSMKHLMLEHAFRFVSTVYFHVGINNVRSRTAMERLGGQRVRELQVEYYGEPSRHNVEYKIERAAWLQQVPHDVHSGCDVQTT